LNSRCWDHPSFLYFVEIREKFCNGRVVVESFVPEFLGINEWMWLDTDCSKCSRKIYPIFCW